MVKEIKAFVAAPLGDPVTRSESTRMLSPHASFPCAAAGDAKLPNPSRAVSTFRPPVRQRFSVFDEGQRCAITTSHN